MCIGVFVLGVIVLFLGCMEDIYICTVEDIYLCFMTCLFKSPRVSEDSFLGLALQSSDRKVSLAGLGHARGLTVHRTVIQHPRAATLLAAAQAAISNK